MKLLFAGGDRRSLIAAEFLKAQGYAVEVYALPHRTVGGGRDGDVMVLPWPALRAGKINAPLCPTPPTPEELLTETGFDRNKPVFGGPMENNPFPRYTDLSRQETLKRRNGVTTAEGAIALLIGETDRAVFGMKCLVLGYGAIGERLCYLLASFGAEVTVSVRKDLARHHATLHGIKTVSPQNLQLQGYHAVFNTVPSLLLTHEVLQTSEPDALFFELASAPGGIDRTAAAKLGRSVVDGPGLPGKVAPVTAGEDLAKTVIELLNHL